MKDYNAALCGLFHHFISQMTDSNRADVLFGWLECEEKWVAAETARLTLRLLHVEPDKIHYLLDRMGGRYSLAHILGDFLNPLPEARPQTRATCQLRLIDDNTAPGIELT